MFLRIRTYIVLFACSCLLLGSCTKDYFVSERNVRLYIPQLADGELENLTMVFHGSNGEFLHRRTVTSGEIQSSSDKLVTIFIPVNGISGSEVIITCISDLDDANNFDHDLISDGTDFFTSKISSYSKPDNPNRFYPSADYRFYRYRKIVKPLGAGAQKVDTLDVVGTDHLHKGKIDLVFKSLPSEVKNARVRYYGLGSSLDFYGQYKGEAAHYKEVIYTLPGGSTPQTVSSTLLPSRGTHCANNICYGDMSPTPSPSSGRSLSYSKAKATPDEFIDLHVEFLGSNGDVLGSYRLSEDSQAPTITNSDNSEVLPANKTFLESQGKLKFEFEGFTLFRFELEGWGDDTTDSEIIPM